jgi:hypothetical protein
MVPIGGFAADFSDLLHALADLAWPAVVLAAILLFKSEISALFGRIRPVKGPAGTEVELDRDLDLVLEKTYLAAQSLPEEPAQPPPAQEPPEDLSTEADLDSADRIYEEAARSPKVALMALSALIDRRSHEVLASSQEPEHWEQATLGQKLHRLDLSPDLRLAAAAFQEVRARIVHGHEATDEDALRAIDIGVTLLRTIDRLPHGLHYVVEPSVECFEDANGERPFTDFHGVLLEPVPQTQGKIHLHAFPTTRDHFRKGKPVSWEWNRFVRYPEAWYRDPRDGEIKYGWTGALEFVGRPLEDL